MDMYTRIKNLRTDMGMSQGELARLTGYTDRSSIAKIEAGHVDLTQSKINAFAKALNTTPSYLMGWDNEKETVPSERQRFNDFVSSLDEEQLKKFLEIGKVMFGDK